MSDFKVVTPDDMGNSVKLGLKEDGKYDVDVSQLDFSNIVTDYRLEGTTLKLTAGGTEHDVDISPALPHVIADTFLKNVQRSGSQLTFTVGHKDDDDANTQFNIDISDLINPSDNNVTIKTDGSTIYGTGLDSDKIRLAISSGYNNILKTDTYGSGVYVSKDDLPQNVDSNTMEGTGYSDNPFKVHVYSDNNDNVLKIDTYGRGLYVDKSDLPQNVDSNTMVGTGYSDNPFKVKVYTDNERNVLKVDDYQRGIYVSKDDLPQNADNSTIQGDGYSGTPYNVKVYDNGGDNILKIDDYQRGLYVAASDCPAHVDNSTLQGAGTTDDPHKVKLFTDGGDGYNLIKIDQYSRGLFVSKDDVLTASARSRDIRILNASGSKVIGFINSTEHD